MRGNKTKDAAEIHTIVYRRFVRSGDSASRILQWRSYGAHRHGPHLIVGRDCNMAERVLDPNRSGVLALDAF